MNNSYPIASIRTATDEQFITLFNILEPDDCTKSDFVKEYKSKRTQAQQDAKVLEKLGVTYIQVVEKLSRIISKANAVFVDAYDVYRNDTRPPEFKVPILRSEVDDEGISFTVSGFELREFGSEECPLCYHRIFGPGTYIIENARTHEVIKVREMFSHFLKCHDYFAKPSDTRIDPTTICRVLVLRAKAIQAQSYGKDTPSHELTSYFDYV